MGSILLLPEPLRAEMEILAQRGYPRECCGLLLGRAEGVECRVVHQHPAHNHASGHDRYEIAPEDYLAAEREAQAGGLRVVGVWHTHPDHPAEPSATDWALAWQDWSYVIVSVARGQVAEWRSWRLEDGDFAEEEIRHA